MPLSFPKAGGSGSSVSDSNVTIDPPIDGANNQRDLNIKNDVQIGLRETAATGIVSGGDITDNGDLTINISAGSGEIVDAYTNRREPTKIDVVWNDINNAPVNIIDNFGLIIFFIDSTGSLQQQNFPLTPQQKRTNIKIAAASIENGLISAVSNGGIHSNEVGNTLYDYISTLSNRDRTINGNAKGLLTSLSVFVEPAKVFAVGVNTKNDLEDPNFLTLSGQGDINTAALFDIISIDGSILSANQTILPAQWQNVADNTVNTVNNTNGVIHYLYTSLSGKLFLQLGQEQYNNVERASRQLAADAATYTYFDGSEFLILTAQIYMKGNAVDFTNINNAGIVNKIGISSGDVSDISGGNKNYIINPTFIINQRGFVGGGTLNAYTYDRWLAANGSNISLVDLNGFITIQFAASRFSQFIENIGVEGNLTVSWDGTCQAEINDDGVMRDSPFTIDTTSLWVTGSDSKSLKLGFRSGTLKNVKVEVGTNATLFEYPDVGTELAKCQRYYQVFGLSESVTRFGFGMNSNLGQVSMRIPFINTMRIAPALNTNTNLNAFVLSDLSTAHTVNSITHNVLASDGINSMTLDITTVDTLTDFRPYFLQASSSQAFISLNAEL